MIIGLKTHSFINPKHIVKLGIHKEGEQFFVRAKLSTGELENIDGPFPDKARAEIAIKRIGAVW